MNAEDAFLSNLPAIERILQALCRRNALVGDDADDFASWAKERLIADDYSVVRKHRGESSLATYLSVVLAMLLREYRVQRWGRWRPSAEARRRGYLAVRLETLVYRDGYRVDEAAEVVCTSGETGLPRSKVAALLWRLPHRTPPRRREIGPEALRDVYAEGRADGGIRAEIVDRERLALQEAITHAMEQLPSEDRLIVQMRFWEGLGVADIARALHLPQKPLYRRLERALSQLREELQAARVSAGRARGLLEEIAA